MSKNKLGIQINKRFTVQMIFLALALLATMADFAYIHYVCPVCGVITAQQLMGSDIPLYLKLHNPAAVILGGMLLTAVLFGPIFCGWICPFGGYQDMISKLADRVMPSRRKIRLAPKLDNALRYLRYGVLALVIYMTAKGSVALLESNNPYHALLNLVKGEFAVGGLVFLVVITLMAWFIDRPWCKYLCPYGSVLGLSNGIKLFKVVRNEESCVSCKKCNKACPMNLDIASSKAVTHHQCISCFECTHKKVCPVNKTMGIALTPPGESGLESLQSKVKVGVASGLILAMAGAGFAATGMKESDAKDPSGSSTSGSKAAQVKTEHASLNRTSAATAKAIQKQSGKYIDGIYTAESTGYQPGLKVQVTVQNKKITDVSIVQHNETPGFYERAFRMVPSEIVMTQGTQVDTVSGATYSSKGIIKAVNKALATAIDPTYTAVTTPGTSATSVAAATSTVASGTAHTSSATSLSGGSTVHATQSTGKKVPATTAQAAVPSVKLTHSASNEKSLKDRDHEKDFDEEDDWYLDEDHDFDDEDDNENNDDQPRATSNQNLQTPSAVAKSVTTVTKPVVKTSTSTKATGLYKNGTYYGTGNGYQPGLKVKVVVSQNQITDVQLVSSQETPRFLNRVWSTVTGSIISKQSSQVDTVSGATYSSEGIMEAVRNALANANL